MSGMGRPIAAGAAGLVALVVILGAAAGGALGGILGGTGANIAPTTSALATIPGGYLALYQQAATTCPGLSWTVLAAIGTVESANGQSTLPGVRSGANVAGAMGPLQMLGPTFAAYDQPVPPGGANPPSPYDPTDAIYSAARMLCADGGRNDANLPQAVWDYNHSRSYVAQVLSLAQSYGQAATQTVSAGSGGGIAVDWALAQVGTPYVWGGETPGVGFDCSGLVQAAYKVAGINLPRVAQNQFDAGPQLAAGTPIQPGDLVFFGSSSADVSHVGLVVRPGIMIDAPHTGADVREEAFPSTVGATWGGDLVVGFTRPR